MADFSLAEIAQMQSDGPTLEDVKQMRAEPKVGTKGPMKKGGTGGGLSDAAIAAAAPPWQPPTLADTAKEGGGNFVYGAAKGLADPVYGASQLVMHGANAITGGRLQGMTDDYDSLIRNVEDQYQSDTPGSWAAGAGRLAGNLAVPIKGVQLLKGASAIPRAVNAAGTGALIGATQPITAGDNYWGAKGLQVGVGGVAGGGLSLTGSALGGSWNAVKPLVAPKSATGDLLYRGVQKEADAGNVGSLVNDPEAFLARLKAAGELLPGSRPTTAQVAGLPALVMAEKTLKNNPAYRIGFEDRAIANNDARMSALRQIASTPKALEDAITARQQAAGPFYEAANAETHAITPELQAILNRPSAQSAIARGQKLAAERGEAAGITGGAPAVPDQQVPSLVLDATGSPAMTTVIPGQAATPGTINGKTLQYLKMGIDDLQKEGKVAGIGAHESAALGATRNDLDNWLIGNSPTFKAANNIFATHSVPINTMEAGQGILGALENGTLNASGDVAPALSQFRTQYAKAMKNSPYGIDPAAEKTLDAIQADLQRETVSNSIRSAGSDTAFNLKAPNWLSGKLFGEGLDGSSTFAKALGGVGGFLTGGPVGAYGGYVAGKNIGAFAGNRVNTQLQQAMLDPAYFAQLLREASARQSGGGLLGVPTRAGTVGSEDALGLLSGN